MYELDHEDVVLLLERTPGTKAEKQEYFREVFGIRVPRGSYAAMIDRLYEQLDEDDVFGAVLQLAVELAHDRVIELLAEAQQGSVELRSNDPAIVECLFDDEGDLTDLGEALLHTRVRLGEESEPSDEGTAMNDDARHEYDLFICHASEDKPAIVEPLADALRAAGYSAWYDAAELRWGDSLSGKINEGLRRSRYVLVVLSPNFMSKNWPRRELDASIGHEASAGQVRVLPLLCCDEHERAQILGELPLIQDKLYQEWRGDPDEVVRALESLLGTPPRNTRARRTGRSPRAQERGQPGLRFHDGESYEFDRMAIVFRGTDGATGATVLCVASREALEDAERAASLSPQELMSAFRKRRSRIEEILRGKYQRRQVEADGALVLKSRDLN